MSIDKIGAKAEIAKPQEVKKAKQPTSKQELQVPEITPEAKEKVKATKNNLIANYAPEIVGAAVGAGGSAFAAYKVNGAVKPVKQAIANAKDTSIEFAKLADNAKYAILNRSEATKEIADLFSNKNFATSVMLKLATKFPELKGEFERATKEDGQVEAFLSKAKESISTAYPEMTKKIPEIFDETTLEAVKEELKNPETLAKLQKITSNVIETGRAQTAESLMRAIMEAEKVCPNSVNATKVISENISIIKREIKDPEIRENISNIVKKYASETNVLKDTLKETDFKAMFGEIKRLDLPENIKGDIAVLEDNVPKIINLLKEAKTMGSATADITIWMKDMDPEIANRVVAIIAKNVGTPSAEQLSNMSKSMLEELSEVVSADAKEAIKAIEDSVNTNKIAEELADAGKRAKIIEILKNELGILTGETIDNIGTNTKAELPQTAEFLEKLIKTLSSEDVVGELTNKETASKVLAELQEALPKEMGASTKAAKKKLTNETLDIITGELKTSAPKTGKIVEDMRIGSKKILEIMRNNSEKADGAGKKMLGKVREYLKDPNLSLAKTTEDKFDGILKNVNKYQKIAIGACMLL
ncbi:hypothetical protein IKA15_02845, partial [bacterium]|nr:hypothetical protein [bacterium]